MIFPIQSICSLKVFHDRDRNGPDKPPFDPDDWDSSDRPDRTAFCQRLIRPQSSLIICRRSWNGRGRLLRHFGERDDGEDRGNRKRRRLQFSALPISHRGHLPRASLK